MHTNASTNLGWLHIFTFVLLLFTCIPFLENVFLDQIRLLLCIYLPQNSIYE